VGNYLSVSIASGSLKLLGPASERRPAKTIAYTGAARAALFVFEVTISLLFRTVLAWKSGCTQLY
jgi:hypothetical protein